MISKPHDYKKITSISDHLSKADDSEYIPLTDEIVEYIESEISRTGLTPYQYCRRKDEASQLTEGKISRWRCREAKAIKQDDLREFISIWSNEPDGKERIELTEQAVAILLNEKERTGVGSVALLLNASDVPKGLTANLVQTWITKWTVTARRDHYEFVKNAWRALPDDTSVFITPQVIQELQTEAQRTGKGAAALMRGLRPSEVGGLSSSIIKSWLSGRVETATSEQLAFVLDRWRSLPNKGEKSEETKQQKPKRIPLTDAMRDALWAERQRTGVSEKVLVAIQASEGEVLPPFRTINRWINGNVKTVDGGVYEAVLNEWRQRPNRMTQPRQQ